MAEISNSMPKVRLKTLKEGFKCLRSGVILCLVVSALIVGVKCNRPPRFLIDGQSEIVVRLKEGSDTPVGSLIYRLRGVDPDGDRLTFGVRDQQGSSILQLEAISANEVNIYLAKELDREVRDEYSFVLTLTDGHLGEGNFITQSFLLLVEDVNDNEPVFKPYPTAITVREDSPPGVLTTVEATDPDEGAYGQVLYQLQELDGDVDSFAIQTNNGKGIIRLVRKLDYERKSLYQLRILAVDRANQGRVNTGTAAILVKVQDVEDQPPEFTAVVPVTRISEDAPIGSSVLQVKAIDGDRGVNNRISYEIISGGEDLFEIDATSGIIYTINQLDREEPNNNNGAYILEILATEESQFVSPGPSVNTEVTIIVTDINDETPTFRSKRYICEISENAQQNMPLTYLRDALPEVFDYDQGKNGTFELYLDGDNGVFDVTPFRGINEASFLIRVADASKLDYELITVMNFSIVAKETVPLNPKMSAVPVTVHIKDENDNVPEFTEAVYRVTIPENCGAGTTVAWVQALDMDSDNFGTRGIRYTNLSGSIAHLLDLNALSGLITVRQPGGETFDRELVSRHYLTVEARDDLGRGNRNTAQLIIDIEDVNDNAPMFLALKYEAKLVENEDDFEHKLILEARDADLNGSKNSLNKYEILEGEFKENFTIDPDTGVLRPLGVIDFERIPGENSFLRPIHLKVRARDFGTPPLASQVPVTVHVQDANDHAPMFQQIIYQRTIPEDMAGGTKVIQVKATDEDGSSPNNVVVYRIQKGASDKFVIDSSSGIISVARGSNLDPDLNHPNLYHYTLTVVALDGGIGDQQLSAAVLVNISILDVNNKPPVFVEPGTIVVKENTQVGSVIYRAEAHDLDSGAILRYDIARESSTAKNEDGIFVNLGDYDYLSVFDLNQIDGTIKVVRLLDREVAEVIKLVLTVEDIAAVEGGPRQTASATLTILVDDENDNNPVFTEPFYKRAIPENSKNGVTIANIHARDADRNRTITYYLEGAEDFTKLVHLERETGEVVVANKIDHEIFSWINLTVKAVDSGIPPRSSLAQLFIQVLDENDNNPIFDPMDASIRVLENTPVDSVIGFVTAKDFDAGEYGKVTYILDRLATQGKFKIDPETGALSISDQLDRETQSTYNLIVEAWDNYQYGFHAGESRNAFKHILVTVEDANDNPPILVVPEESCLWASELATPSESIGVIRAIDKDDSSTPNGRVRIDIVDGNGFELFQAEQVGGDSNTARIYPIAPLRDRHGNYTLIVEATDLGEPKNRISGEVTVCITDYNDHPPVFVSHQTNQTVKVSENSTIDSVLFRVHAIDADVGANGAVRYRLKGGDTRNTFALHSLTGDLILKRPFDREKQKLYQLRIEAYDLGTPTSLSSELELWIYVRAVNSYKPRFMERVFYTNFTENGRPGEETERIPSVMDREDESLTDEPVLPVCYYIVEGDERAHFRLHPENRVLSVAKSLDREQQRHYNLTTLAVECASKRDKVDDPLASYDPESTLTVFVTVFDVNDNPPKFYSKVFTAGITTEADFGTEFMQIKAHDPDEGENANVTYHLLGDVKRTLSEGLESLQVPPFSVHPFTGAVALNFDPQKGMKGYFDFEVVAKDPGGLKDEAHVFIYLLREDQRVKFVLRQHPSEIRDRARQFRQKLAAVTGAIVNIDDVKIHENKDGSVDHTKSDLYMHLVNGKDHSVMEVDQVLELIDKNVEQLDDLFKEYNVLDTRAAEWAAVTSYVDGAALAGLGAGALALAALSALLLALCLIQRTVYLRRLRAATAHAYSTPSPGESDLTLRSSPARVPNTNKHSTQGSNPIWLQAYESDWYKPDEDQLTSHSERDSLDENVMTQDSEKPYFITSNVFPSLESNGSDRMTQRAKYDFYQHLEQLNNVKNLETTEL